MSASKTNSVWGGAGLLGCEVVMFVKSCPTFVRM